MQALGLNIHTTLPRHVQLYSSALPPRKIVRQSNLLLSREAFAEKSDWWRQWKVWAAFLKIWGYSEHNSRCNLHSFLFGRLHKRARRLQLKLITLERREVFFFYFSPRMLQSVQEDIQWQWCRGRQLACRGKVQRRSPYECSGNAWMTLSGCGCWDSPELN